MSQTCPVYVTLSRHKEQLWCGSVASHSKCSLQAATVLRVLILRGWRVLVALCGFHICASVGVGRWRKAWKGPQVTRPHPLAASLATFSLGPWTLRSLPPLSNVLALRPLPCEERSSDLYQMINRLSSPMLACADCQCEALGLGLAKRRARLQSCRVVSKSGKPQGKDESASSTQTASCKASETMFGASSKLQI